MPQSPGISLPPELVSLIANVVAKSGHDIRTPAIAACRLVCTMFAVQFRPHLFEFLDISSVGMGRIDNYRMLKRRIFILLDNPGYARLVKRVTITLTSDPWDEYPPMLHGGVPIFTGNHPAFSELLNLLPSVSSLYLDSTLHEQSFSFLELCKASREAIERICHMLPSLKSLRFNTWFDLPLPILTGIGSTNLENLRFHYIYSGSS
ncbi:hypothetical protein BKA70DRAFT_1437333 [Coprinopsis sp. MPI-PUGE-AT-0042]|nr:hypothetical protein BKA70DRAFT_1437333 [Coprinopsis sp. MPI-PUGE-AT-0042]